MENSFTKKIKQNLHLRPALVAEHVTRILTEAILEGNLLGGDRLLEEELQSVIGVSRAPIREAFHNLEGKGLVQIVPRKGAFVRVVTRKDVDEFFPILALMEGLAARLAVTRLTHEDLMEMRKTLNDMKIACRNKDAKAFREHHNEFHQIYIRASNSTMLQKILQDLRMHVMWYRFTLKYHQEDLKQSLEVHRHIEELFRHRLGDKVEPAVREHVEAGHQKFVKYLSTNDE
jgi:DNA-binding GntR family transcriptional regulator